MSKNQGLRFYTDVDSCKIYRMNPIMCKNSMGYHSFEDAKKQLVFELKEANIQASFKLQKAIELNEFITMDVNKIKIEP